MVLADAEEVEPDLVGELDLLDEVCEAPRCVDLLAGDRIRTDVAECEEPEFHRSVLPAPFREDWAEMVTDDERRQSPPVNSPSTLRPG